MKKKHRVKVEARIALARRLLLEDPTLPRRLSNQFHMKATEAHNTLVALQMLFDTDLPNLLEGAQGCDSVTSTSPCS